MGALTQTVHIHEAISVTSPNCRDKITRLKSCVPQRYATLFLKMSDRYHLESAWNEIIVYLIITILMQIRTAVAKVVMSTCRIYIGQ